jgi:hypothetical protein
MQRNALASDFPAETVSYLLLAQGVHRKKQLQATDVLAPMKSWRPTLEKLSRALEFANVTSLRDLEAMLDRDAEREVTGKLQAAECRAARKPITSATTHYGAILRLVEHH